VAVFGCVEKRVEDGKRREEMRLYRRARTEPIP
jgi:hypothetical protein